MTLPPLPPNDRRYEIAHRLIVQARANVADANRILQTLEGFEAIAAELGDPLIALQAWLVHYPEGPPQ
jgi:hypothetical protein